jgi:hypothetical protein
MGVLSHLDHMHAAVDALLDRRERHEARLAELRAEVVAVEAEVLCVEADLREVTATLTRLSGGAVREVPPLVRPPTPSVPADPVVLPAVPSPAPAPTGEPVRPAASSRPAKPRAKGVITPSEAGDVGYERRPGRPGRPPSVDYGEVARVYLEAVAEVIQALMDHFGVTREVAKNWPPRLRKQGLLPPRDQPQVPATAPVRAAPRYMSGSLVA